MCCALSLAQHDWETIVNEEPVLALISKKHPEPEFERKAKHSMPPPSHVEQLKAPLLLCYF